MKPRILYIQYTNPACYPPLEHSSHILAEDGWEVLFLGAHNPGVEALRFEPHPQIRVRNLPTVRPKWLHHVRYLIYCIWVIASCIYFRPRWVYASDAWSYLPALLISYSLRVPILLHEHDYQELHVNRIRRFIAKCRARLAKRAVICVIPQQQRAIAFHAELKPKQTIVVWNCPSINDIGFQQSTRSGLLRLIYIGSIVQDRLPLALIQTVERMPKVQLQIIGYPTSESIEYYHSLLKYVFQHSLESRIQILPPQPRSQLKHYLQSAHVGVATLPSYSKDVNMVDMVGASNKVFEYFASGLAIVVTAGSYWNHCYVKPGYAKAVLPEYITSMTHVIQWFLDHPEETRLMGESGRQRVITEWNYETQFEPVRILLCLLSDNKSNL